MRKGKIGNGNQKKDVVLEKEKTSCGNEGETQSDKEKGNIECAKKKINHEREKRERQCMERRKGR